MDGITKHGKSSNILNFHLTCYRHRWSPGQRHCISLHQFPSSIERCLNFVNRSKSFENLMKNSPPPPSQARVICVIMQYACMFSNKPKGRGNGWISQPQILQTKSVWCTVSTYLASWHDVTMPSNTVHVASHYTLGWLLFTGQATSLSVLRSSTF